jgi:DNA-directed RNA polymerase subunit alpha
MLEKVYKPLTLPDVKWEKKSLSGTLGELTVQPLEPGFGITLGNALRRVILSSVEGSAVTSVIIKDVNNEFSTVKGVIEDTLQLLLNIKQIVVKNNTGKPGKMHLNIKGESVARVQDIVADNHLELINKDHIIAHIAPDGELDVEFFVEQGRGYQAAQWPVDSALQEDGKIYIDAMFSPIKKVEVHTEKTRVGQSIDYDKLVLSIYTNGAESPVDALHYGSSVLRTQFEHFLNTDEIPFNEISEARDEHEDAQTVLDVQGPTKGLPVELFLKPIDELEFSVRAHNCLVAAGIKRVIDLVNLADDDLLKIKNFGRKSLREVKEILTAFGLHLGMNVKELDLKKVIKKQEDNLKS